MPRDRGRYLRVVDYFKGRATAETDLLDWLFTRERVLVGDLILAEILRRFPSDAGFQ
jgi:hypothetical protein